MLAVTTELKPELWVLCEDIAVNAFITPYIGGKINIICNGII